MEEYDRRADKPWTRLTAGDKVGSCCFGDLEDICFVLFCFDPTLKTLLIPLNCTTGFDPTGAERV